MRRLFNGDRFVFFCDWDRSKCSEYFDTGTNLAGAARDRLKRAGWWANGNRARHLCPRHDEERRWQVFMADKAFEREEERRREREREAGDPGLWDWVPEE